MELNEITKTITTITVTLTPREVEILYHALNRNEDAYRESGNAKYFTFDEEEKLWRSIANIRSCVCNT